MEKAKAINYGLQPVTNELSMRVAIYYERKHICIKTTPNTITCRSRRFIRLNCLR